MPTTQKKTNGTDGATGRFRSFDIATDTEEEVLEPLAFELGGEQFQCLPEPTLGGRRLFFGAVQDGRMGVLDCIEAIRSSLLPGDEERFDALLNRKDLRISNSVVGDLFNWLLEQYTTRPTKPPSS